MSRGDQPLVSVIVPTFNRARYLPDALASIARQGVNGVETIVVDDGSTDDTERVVAETHSAVNYVRTEHRGAAAARNTGVAHATGRFISFLDSDDVWLAGKMRSELDAFEQHPAADAVISDSERWRDGELVCGSWLTNRGLAFTTNAPVVLRPIPHLRAGKIFATCSLTMRRAAIDRLGAKPFDTSFETHEDMDLAVRMYRCCTVVVVPRVLAQVRRFDDGTRVRPVPGTAFPPEVKRLMAQRRYRVYDKALGLGGWPDAAVTCIREARSEAARDFADNLQGWRRHGLVSMALAEIRHAAFGSAAAVVVRGVLPHTVRQALRSVGALAPERVDGAPIVPPLSGSAPS